jgi:hypothetical protein
MAPNNISQPTETSPLLATQDDHARSASAPNNFTAEAGESPVEHEEDGADIERQISNGDSVKHLGLPEVRKRMKYIFPAIAIGV